MKTLRAIITLILLSPILAELISESTPLPLFFTPGTLVWFILGYGLPVLVIREVAVRARLSSGAIFTIGVGYGMFNEGLLAKTLIIDTNLPIHQFDHYGYFFGISFPWTATISLWHGIASVLFPILFTHALNPEARDRPWLNRGLTIGLGVVLLGLASLAFLGKSRVPGTPQQLTILLGLMLGCVLLALCLPKRTETVEVASSISLKPVFLGFSIFLFYIVLSFLAGARAPLILFFAILCFGVWACIRILKTHGWLDARHLMVFGIGCYMESALQGSLTRVVMRSVPVIALITGALAETLLLWAALRLRSSAREDATVPYR